MPNRTVCSVLEEMRKAYKSRNFAHLLGLVEEVQTLANRMEAAIWDQHDVEALRNETKALKQEIKDLETKKRQSKG